MQPKKGMCSVNAHCLQEQRFSVHPGGVFVMQTDMRMEHIPYADCFKVQSFWKVREHGSRVECKVACAGCAEVLEGARTVQQLAVACIGPQCPSSPAALRFIAVHGKVVVQLLEGVRALDYVLALTAPV
jgi:hypothetical protein